MKHKKKSLGQIAYDVWWDGETETTWDQADPQDVQIFTKAAKAVERETHKRDKAKQQWIKVSDRLPTKKDGDYWGNIIIWMQGRPYQISTLYMREAIFSHWMRTDLKKPQTPNGA